MSPNAFEPVKAAWPDAEYWEESGLPYAYIPSMSFSSGGNSLTMKVLICPAQRDGYASRLFFEKQVPGRGANWKVFQIRGQQWWACSWGNVAASMPWLVILANHLRPLQ
jgi:hypothetical protein